MKKLILSCLLLSCVSAAFSQKLYFIYLQSDDNAGFFVKLNERVHSSTASGYLLLSKLRDSTYNLTVSFPQGKWPEQRFTISMKGKDHGYLLKNFGDKGWGLFDWQTGQVVSSLSPSPSSRIKSEPREVSPFTEILALAANDPSLRERPVLLEERTAATAKTSLPVGEKKTTAEPQQPVKKEEKKLVFEPPAEKPAEKKDIVTLENSQPEKPATILQSEPGMQTPDTLTQKAAAVNNPQTSRPDSNTAAGQVVETRPARDTMAIAMEPEMKKPDSTRSAETGRSKDQELVIQKPETVAEKPADPVLEVKEEKIVYQRSRVSKRSESSTTEGFGLTFIDEMPDGSKDTIRIMIPNGRKSNEARPVANTKKFLEIAPPDSQSVAAADGNINPNCTAAVSDADMAKLRKKMAAEEDDDDKVDEARKVFRSKCLTTAQVRTLADLFPADIGRYKFLDAVYNFVSDREGFGQLSSLLKDDYYVNRFKAMLR